MTRDIASTKRHVGYCVSCEPKQYCEDYEFNGDFKTQECTNCEHKGYMHNVRESQLANTMSKYEREVKAKKEHQLIIPEAPGQYKCSCGSTAMNIFRRKGSSPFIACVGRIELEGIPGWIN